MSDGAGGIATATVMLVPYVLPQPANKSYSFDEDALSPIVLAKASRCTRSSPRALTALPCSLLVPPRRRSHM